MLRRFELGMVSLHYTYNSVDDVGKTPATFALAFQCTENLGRNDQLPGIFVKQTSDGLFDLFLTDDVAVTNQHGKQ